MTAPKSPILAQQDKPSPKTGEQDQGIPFKGPTAAAAASTDSSAVETTPEVEQGEFPPLKNHMASALRKDSFQNIGQRRRSSASNQPTANLRRAQGYSKDNEMARNVGA